MADTPRTTDELLALFADNTTGAISAQDLRDFVASTDNVVNVKGLGALGDGSADDSAAIQAAVAAVNASKGTLYFPPGTYKYASSTDLIPGISTAWVGAGQAASVLRFTGSGAVALAGSTVYMTFNSMTFQTQGTAPCFTWPENAYASNITMIDSRIESLVTGQSCFYGTNNMTANFCKFIGTDFYMPTGATVPAINWTGGSMNANTWIGCLFQANGGPASAVPFVFIDNSNDSGYIYQNNFKDIWCENTTGGVIHMNSCRFCHIEDLVVYDLTTPMTASIIKLGKHGSSGQLSSDFRVERIHNTATFGASTYAVDVGSGGGHTGIVSGTYNHPIKVSSYTTVLGSAPSVVTGTPAVMQSYKDGHTAFPGGLSAPVKEGAPIDGDYIYPSSGMIALDTTNSRIYFRVGTTWKYAALT